MVPRSPGLCGEAVEFANSGGPIFLSTTFVDVDDDFGFRVDDP